MANHIGLCCSTVNFILSIWYGATFWICNQDNVKDIPVFLSVAHQRFYSIKPFLLIMLPSSMVLLHKNWKRTEANADKLIKGIFHKKSWDNEGRREEYLELWHLSSQVSVMHKKAMITWNFQNIWLPMGSNKLVPYFDVPVCAASALPVTVLILTTSFLAFLFTHLFLLHCPPGSEKESE